MPVCAVKPLVIILPLLLVQYVLAIFALTRLAMCRFRAGRYVVWNIAIVLGVFIGPAAFLVYYYVRRKAAAETEELAEEAGKAAQKVDTPTAALYNDSNVNDDNKQGE